jgi:hypothetical protein
VVTGTTPPSPAAAPWPSGIGVAALAEPTSDPWPRTGRRHGVSRCQRTLQTLIGITHPGVCEARRVSLPGSNFGPRMSRRSAVAAPSLRYRARRHRARDRCCGRAATVLPGSELALASMGIQPSGESRARADGRVSQTRKRHSRLARRALLHVVQRRRLGASIADSSLHARMGQRELTVGACAVFVGRRAGRTLGRIAGSSPSSGIHDN